MRYNYITSRYLDRIGSDNKTGQLPRLFFFVENWHFIHGYGIIGRKGFGYAENCV